MGVCTHGNGMVEITTQPASSLDVFRQWIEDGLTGADEIAQEMGITKGAVSKLAKKGIEAGWLTKHGREYVLI
jgi:predicted transcriptional regulator